MKKTSYNNNYRKNYNNYYSNNDNYQNYSNKYSNNNYYNSNYENSSPTHFINFPINDNKFIESYNRMIELIKNENQTEGSLFPKINPYILQKEGKLHFTICVLTLNSEEDVLFVKETLSNLFKTPTFDDLLKFKFESFQPMSNHKKNRVIYGDIGNDGDVVRLKELISFIISTLVDNEIMDQNSLSRSHFTYNKNKKLYESKIHCTIMNTLFLNKWEKKNKIELTNSIPYNNEVLDYLNKTYLDILSEIKIDSMNFSEMREDHKTNKYIVVKEYKLV